MFGEDRSLGAVIARPAFRIDGERLSFDAEQPMPIEPAPMDTPYGSLPADTPFLSGGIDVFVIGQAHAPLGKPASELRVDVAVGSSFRRSIRVVGDRVWRARAAAGGKTTAALLEPTPPVPFTAMPLTWDRAFGGRTRMDDYDYFYPANPDGRGFYASADLALGKPLPNLEDVDAPITSVDDRPEPVGTAPYPQAGSLKSLNALDLTLDQANPEDSRIERIKPLLFNSASPRMIIPPAQSPKPGELIEVTNVRPSGPIRFTMPDLAMHAHVQLEDRQYVFPLHLDQIGILAEESRVFLSFRVAFKYRIVPRERRRTTLRRGPAPAEIPADYTVAWDG